MTAALFFHTVAAMDRIIGTDPNEPAAPAAEPCSTCDGRGVVENDDTDSLHTPMWRTCTVCEGAGTVDPFLDPAADDEPNVLDDVDPVWGLPTHVRLRLLRERSTS